ncbi:uncharacterized protein LOC125476886 isoform X2 [Pyrus x bretschneideri]|uniref:uncharacterized protein LOC125476886 isoform X2 n=1 Tax=Pyrus x bretschneideri TaxID=225117 RepID=UPI00203069F9|nr:uncharacterized protein LOC125476886 isoform X2 [Pyrus x bretschneideri]
MTNDQEIPANMVKVPVNSFKPQISECLIGNETGPFSSLPGTIKIEEGSPIYQGSSFGVADATPPFVQDEESSGANQEGESMHLNDNNVMNDVRDHIVGSMWLDYVNNN